ncbi:hypothetical protein LDENG_00134500, partial [Lucifuga dentata]
MFTVLTYCTHIYLIHIFDIRSLHCYNLFIYFFIQLLYAHLSFCCCLFSFHICFGN